MWKILIILSMVLRAAAWSQTGYVWDLAANWNASVNGATVTSPSGSRGVWTYHNSFGTAYTVAQTNNFPTELPPNDGWRGPADFWISLNRFNADAVGLKTNYKAGQVGGHTGTGATWTSLDGGIFRIDGSGFQARIQGPPNTTGELGRNCYLTYRDPSGTESFLMDAVLNNGSGNAFHILPRYVVLAPGESVTLRGDTASTGDWVGLNFSVRELGSWDAKAQWSDTNNPNGVWSYRDASNAQLLLATGSGVGGSPGGWSKDGTSQTIPNLFDDPWSSVQEPNEFGGHGPWLVRWQSPINGYIQVSGSLLQLFEPTRRMQCQLKQNGTQFFTGLVPQDLSGNTLIAHPGGDPGVAGPDARAGLLEFGPFVRTVEIGDTIDYLAVAGGGLPTFVLGSFHIEEVTEPQVPLPPARIDGDINRDNCVDFNDLSALAAQWLRDDCMDPRWCEGADIDASNFVDFVDFSYLSANWLQCVVILHHLGFVVVSPNGPTDGGDFGNDTPGTLTGGLQEAFNYGAANNKDVFVVGGGAPAAFSNPVVYWVHTTLYVPAAENWRILGGGGVINFDTSAADCVVFDSQRNGQFSFGLFVAQGPGIQTPYAVAKIKPQTPFADGPADFRNCSLFISCPVGGGSVWGGGVHGQGTSLHLDASNGSITNNRILLPEINACETGVLLTGGEISNNTISCPFNHITNNMVVLHTGSFNTFNMLLNAGGVGGSVIAVNIAAGEQNIFNLAFSGGFASGGGIIFGPAARDNLVYAMGFSPSYITNNATYATNRIVTLGTVGLGMGTPAFPASGTYLENRLSFPAIATIKTTGSVSNWTLVDNNGLSRTIMAPLRTGQTIYLEPGDKLMFVYTIAPTWRWRAVR